MRRMSTALAALTMLLFDPESLARIASDGRLDFTSAALAQTAPKCTTAPCAYRFLAQSTFGGAPSDVQNLLTGHAGGNLSVWISDQMALPAQLSYEKAAAAQPNSYYDSYYLGAVRTQGNDVSEAFWLGAASDSAQLRERVAFALSQIFVISVDDGSLDEWGNASAAYADLLLADAFVNFRTLLNDIAHSDAMGRYLSFLYNTTPGVQANPKPPIPDQNFARELMQLFTIGLVQLNPDGTPQLNGSGNTIPTYSQNDVVGNSYVVTGFGPYDVANQVANDFKSQNWLGKRDAYQYQPAVGYAAYHAAGAKTFLGATTNSDAEGDLKVLLDTLFNHKNTGPFICKQLIQRLVTSNPSPAYVSRVAAKFANNGAGVRGDMAAVIRAILLDPEARVDQLTAQPASFGKIREPILRVAQALRLLGGAPFVCNNDCTSAALSPPLQYASFGLSAPSDSSQAFGQFPYRAPTVFNFYYPNFTPPNSPLSAQTPALVSPEMQITSGATLYQIDGYLGGVLANAGQHIASPTVYRSAPSATLFTVQPHSAFTFNYAAWQPLLTGCALNNCPLVNELNLEFMSGQMSTELRSNLNAEVLAVKGSGPQAQIAQAVRVLMASPEYLVQK